MSRKYDDKMSLDMSFDEALGRFIQADPQETRNNIAKSKQAKPEAERKRPAPKPDQTNVTRLRGRPKA